MKSLESLLLNREPISINYHKEEPKEELFETIVISQKSPRNLSYHQKRVDRSLKEYFQSNRTINIMHPIQSYLKKQQLEQHQCYRLKITYSKNGILKIVHFNYTPKVITKILLVEVANADYSYKFTQRKLFNALHKSFDADEFIITKNGCLTDTTIANIALYHKKEGCWHTPKKPLLPGTTRERLLEKNKIIEKDIDYKSLENYSNIALLNAMIDFKIL